MLAQSVQKAQWAEASRERVSQLLRGAQVKPGSSQQWHVHWFLQTLYVVS